MAIRRIDKEYEAKMMPVGRQNRADKIECKTYGESERIMDARVRCLGDVAPGYASPSDRL